MTEEVAIEGRFRGPPDSANGGYACGVVASHLAPGPAVEANLRAPPPLDKPLAVERTAEGIELRDGDVLVADGKPADAPDLDVPDGVSFDAAEAARAASPLHREHAFPTCFVCGPDQDPADGLRVISGPVPGRRIVASPWETDERIAGEDGSIRPELVWSVLDCPSGNAMLLVPDIETAVLARLTGELRGDIEAGRTYVAIGWPIERDGRKFHSGSAIVDPEDGRTLAAARALWIEPR